MARSSRGLVTLALAVTLITLAFLTVHRRGGGPFTRLSVGERFDFRIDINSADRRALEALPGVGPVLAGRILEQREMYGPFSGPNELEMVRGIGKGRVLSLAPYIFCGTGGEISESAR
jgi:DNA uptake protein ComE-like DNA-binding protein